jgi:hypothetical protein
VVGVLEATLDRQARHGLEAKADCYLCDQAPETIDHLLCECPFTREVWFHILHAIGLQLPPPAHSVRQWWHRLRHSALAYRHRGLDTLFALTSWEIWKECNARCFRQAETSVAQVLQVIKAQADLWTLAGAKHIRSLASGGNPPGASNHVLFFQPGFEPILYFDLYFFFLIQRYTFFLRIREKKTSHSLHKLQLEVQFTGCFHCYIYRLAS